MTRYKAYDQTIREGFDSPERVIELTGTLTDAQAAELKRKWLRRNRPKWIGPWVLDRPDRDLEPDLTPIWMRQYDDGIDSCWTWKVGPEVPW